MNPSLRRLRTAISAARLIPHVVILLTSRNRPVIQADLTRWAEILHLRPIRTTADLVVVFLILMTFTPEYRNVFRLRAGLPARLLNILCPAMADLDIVSPSIGPGLFVQHGNSTFVSAESIGANCWIGRHVVIGYANDTDRPTIGDNVRIFTGAKIIGNIKVGDNATIGLNTVVAGNVPPNSTVLGVPGRVIWRADAKSE